MTLLDIAKLPADQFRVIDKTKQDGYPLKWYNVLTIIHGTHSRQVRRYTAFNHGLCAGVNGEMPPTYQRGGYQRGPWQKTAKS